MRIPPRIFLPTFPKLLTSLSLLVLLAGVVCTLPAAAAQRAEMKIDTARTVLAVVTHKGGVAAGLAHNHLIAAGGYTALLELDPEDPGNLAIACFEMEAQVAKLRVDADPLRAETFPRLQALGLLDEAFEELSEKDRGKIGDAMRGKNQLDAKTFPTLTAKVLSAEKKESTVGEETFPWSVRLAFSVHGKTVERAIPARATVEDGTVTLEAVGAFQFSEFGIEPYSALLGAIKNQDEFHLYARIVTGPESD